MNLSFFLLIGLVLSLLLAWKPRRICQLLLCAYWLLWFAWSLKLLDPFVYNSIEWSSQLNIAFTWHIDGLARLFTLLISGIGALIFIYAAIYAQGYPGLKAKLLALLQTFAISMLTIVLTNNTIVLFLGWEMTTVTSYLLIQCDVTSKKANQAAFNGMFISVIGGLAMLAGFILLSQQTQNWSIQIALNTMQGTPILMAVFWLLLLGAMTKSAQFPFYFWLPGAMQAPTPVSAYLHSATMVNAGIYLLARFHPLLGTLDTWYPCLAFFGMSTMLLSSILSLCQRDLKAILAYTTLFALGLMVYLLAGSQWLAAEAFAMFLLFHGLYKAAAFMWVGTTDKIYATRDIIKLRGVGRKWPLASIVAIVSLSSMAGLPPFFGFAVKEMLFEAKFASGSISYSLMAIGMLSSMFIAAASLKCMYYWFVGQPQAYKQKALRYGLVCPLILATLILGLEFIEPYIAELLSSTASSIIWQPATFEPSGSMQSAILSLVTAGGGIVVFLISRYFKLHNLNWPKWLNPLVWFEQGLSGSLYFGRWFTYLTQRQSMTKQLIFIFAALTVWLGIALLHVGELILTHTHWHIELSWPDYLYSPLLIAIGLSLLIYHRFLTNMVSFAILGLVMSAIFVVYGAPDVAMTQLLIEILTVIILVIALRKARFKTVSLTRKQCVLHGFIALMIGLLVTILLLFATSTPFNTYLSEYFINHSLVSAHGRNVVNVILVDFRAFDTLGEALVIFATALGIWLLLDKKREASS